MLYRREEKIHLLKGVMAMISKLTKKNKKKKKTMMVLKSEYWNGIMGETSIVV